MSVITKSVIEKRSLFTNPAIWGAFILFILVAVYTMMNHEMWGDEIHSWNIAKGSNSFLDLINNSRYEGHPPLWYVILWSISKFTHNLDYVQAVHLIIAILTIFILLFFSPLPFVTKLLIPFGYYFLYEYTVISRNYGIGVLLAFCICLIIHKNFKYKIGLYYFFLFLLANTHLIALLLAISLHLYFLILKFQEAERKTKIVMHILGGSFIFLCSLLFILPPSDGELNLNFFLSRWNFHQVTAVVQLPLRAFVPIPAWWNEHFWNTELLQEAKNNFSLLRFINPLIVLMILGVAFYILRKSKKSLILFFANVILSFIVTVSIFPLTSARYSGFLFIGFIVAYWFSCYEFDGNNKKKWLVNILLGIQIIAGIFIVSKDIRQPFSNAYRINDLLTKVPANEKVVTDYWALNVISAFADKSFYCIDMQKEISFILWGEDIVEMQKRTNRYCDGITNFFKEKGIERLYMVSTGSLESLFKVDPKLPILFQVKLMDKREGAIEKGGNLYLYEIKSLP